MSEPQPPVQALVAAAIAGDEDAWGALVTRYTPLVWGVVRNFQLDRADAADVNQTVWLRLVEHLHRVREPAALPMWIIQTARHECLRAVRTVRRTWPFDPLDGTAEALSPDPDGGDLAEGLLRAERRQALREAFAQLSPRCRHLVTWLLHEPPLSYEEIGARMGMPVGSVGPTRGRCLDKLRHCPALAALAGSPATAGSGRGERRDAATVG